METIVDIDQGAFAEEIKAEKTELSAEELKALEVKRQKLLAEIEERKAEYEATAKKIIEEMSGQPRGTTKAKLVEAKVPTAIIDALLPVETTAAATPEAKK